MKFILIILLYLAGLYNAFSIDVETVEVTPTINYCEADFYGNRIFNENHLPMSYRCYCDYKCIDRLKEAHCMACLVDVNNCTGDEYEYREINLTADLNEFQRGFMSFTHVIAMGDSIMEGAGNSFYGMADILQTFYDVKITVDTSASGCLLTNYQDPYTSIPNVYTQLAYVESVLDLGHLEPNSFIVMDGGTNDQLWGYSTMPGLTFYEPENGEHDLMYSTDYIVKRVLDATRHKVPVIYVIPCLDNLDTTEANVPQMEYLKTLQQEGVYVIDERNLVSTEDFSDSVHINGQGYLKVTKAIAQCVCDYYGYKYVEPVVEEPLLEEPVFEESLAEAEIPVEPITYDFPIEVTISDVEN